MLLEFSVSNHRSFGSEQTLSLIASKLKDQHEDRVAIVDGPHHVEVLTSAILLGKNGSGKSTLVDAMGFVRRFVRGSSVETQQGEPIGYEPHRLTKALAKEDTSFRVLFSMVDVIYQFEFSFTADRVTRESLTVADRTARFRRVYERNFDPKLKTYSYYFGEDLKGDKSIWRSATRDNALFLSTAIQLNAEALRQPFDWLSKYLRAIDAAGSPGGGFTAQECMKEENKERVLRFLQRLDINIFDIRIQDEELDDSVIKEMFTPEFLKKISASSEKPRTVKKVKFVHQSSDGDPVEFDLNDESAGTRALFSLAGPLFDTLANGYCLIIDEVNTHLHPLILHTLIDAFSDPTLNTKRAQLVFTSHDTSLLRDSYFRRDQVWFVDMNRQGQSLLVPLSDYSPRKGEALEKGYLSGRYGGVPALAPKLALNPVPVRVVEA